MTYLASNEKSAKILQSIYLIICESYEDDIQTDSAIIYQQYVSVTEDTPIVSN